MTNFSFEEVESPNFMLCDEENPFGFGCGLVC